ncbi:MAG: 2OG-Fe(II) oxygenase [Salinarimonadaceae bacterium]|nr:MAG: 2OG-Fe(II) oxygenase [Salinarimonadaceae bacterium]
MTSMAKTFPAITQDLDARGLYDLAAQKIDLIHVPGFCPQDFCADLADAVAAHQALEAYRTQSALKRLGMGFVDVDGDPQALGRYQAQALAATRAVRALAQSRLTPIDHLRLILDEVWPAGAMIERIRGAPAFVGAYRVIEPGAAMLPHNDRLARMLAALPAGAPDVAPEGPETPPDSCGMTGQLAVNIYLDMPEQGGEIELWLRHPTPEEDARIGADDGLSRETLEPPKLVFRPAIGDLLIFNARLIHNVAPGVGGRRVSASCFIGCRGTARPLTVWS